MVNNKALRIKLNILESFLPAKRSSAVHDVPHRRRDPLVGIAAVDVVPQSRGTGLVSEDSTILLRFFMPFSSCERPASTSSYFLNMTCTARAMPSTVSHRGRKLPNF